MKSGSCEAPGEHADVGDEDPCDGAGDGGLEVLGETAASPEPGEGTFDDPSARQHLEAFGGVGSLDDVEGETAEFGEPVAKLVAGIGAVGEQMTQPWVEPAHESDDAEAPSRS